MQLHIYVLIMLLCNYKHGNLVRSITLKLLRTFYGTLYKYKASSDDMQRTGTIILPKHFMKLCPFVITNMEIVSAS